jgi:superfamily II DNA or RNA helicase
MCWYLAGAISRRSEGWLPPELEPYRERPDLALRHAERLHAELAAKLASWASRRRPRPDRSLCAVLGLERLADGQATVTFEARLTGPRLQDEPRSPGQLQQLRSAVRQTPGLLSLEQVSLLDLLTDGDTLIYSSYLDSASGLALPGLMRLLKGFSGASCLLWDRDLPDDLMALAGVAPGSPVLLHPEPACLLPTCVTDANGMRIELAFHWPDGRERRLGEAIHLSDRSDGYGQRSGLVLADGEFSIVAEAPPAELIGLFEASGGLPVRREHANTILAPLAASLPSIGAALSARTRFHAVKPAVALDLREDDWLQIRIFARAPEADWKPAEPIAADAVVFEYTPDSRWSRVAPDHGGPAGAAPARDTSPQFATLVEPPGDPGAPDAPASSDGRRAAGMTAADDPGFLLEAPDPARVEPLTKWLLTTGAASGTMRGPGGRRLTAADAHVGWWLRLGPKTAGVVAGAWDQRPEGCEWFGTERVRRLLFGAYSLRPRLRIESSGMDWFSVSAEWEAEGLQLTDADLAKLRASSSRFVKLALGWVRRDAAAVHESAAEVLADIGIEAGGGAQRLTLWQLAQARPESVQAIERLAGGSEATLALRRMREQLAAFTGLPRVAPPARFNGELRSYQQQGLDFLVYTSSLGLGAILADDMGLGKTVQALAWLEVLREREPGAGPALVVCPASVMHNWVREAGRFVPGLRVLLLERGQRRHSLRGAIPDHDLIITNYALLRRDLEDWKAAELGAVILDEAQNIKNPDAGISRAVLELKSRHRLALTGTPLENRALDLWSIMAFANPGHLGSRNSFSARFDRVDAPPHARRLLAAKLRPVMLRRMKQEVAKDLPARIEERRDCEMTRGQRQFYLAELVRSRAQVERLSRSEGDVKKNKIAILAALTRLRQVSCHPALAGGKHALGSGKFEAVFELLEPLLAEGHKVLLFSQFVECLKLLSPEMESRGIAHHTLTGATVHRERVVTAFAEDPRPCVFLVSLKAGGTGLNLTAASYVILFDPWWNPAVEAQAIDRTHRIGQQRTVIAYRMLTQGTVEEKIWELQQRKTAFARDVLGEEGFARVLTRGDLDYLLGES